MGRKIGLTRDAIAAAAAAVADADGIEALSLATVANELGIRPPSLVHHVGGLAGLRRLVALHGAGRLQRALSRSARDETGRAALVAIARGYRRFAREHPGQLGAMLPAPRPGEDDELYDALARPVADIVAVLASLGIHGEDAIHAVRALRSFLHGFADLEWRGGFGMPQKIDESFERGLELFVRGLEARR